MFLSACSNSNSLSTILYIRSIVEIICLLVPSILVIICAFQLFKIVTDKDMDNSKRIIRSIFFKTLAAVAIFFVPTIVGLLGRVTDTGSIYESSCWEKANSTTIAMYQEAEKAEDEAEDAKKKAEADKAQAERDAIEKSREKYRKENEKKAEEEKQKQYDGEQEKGQESVGQPSGTAARLIEVAQKELGVSGRPNKYTYEYGSIGGYSYPWCATFVWWCTKQAGIYPNTISQKTAAVVVYKEYFTQKGQYKVPSQHGGNYTPKMGDLIIFDWGGNAGGGGHIGIVKSVSGGMVYTIEGNSSDSVREKSYSINSPVIIGYGVWE